MRKLLAKHWYALVPAIILVALYFPVLSTYFSHDDFFHFNIGRTDGTLSGFLDLFAIKPYEARGYGFYRQLGREVLFYLYYSVFGLAHLPFRIIAMVLQILNSILVYAFIYDLFKNKKYAVFTSGFFALTTSNVAVLYYLAGGFQMQMVVFFAFISLFSFRSYILHRDIWMRMVSLFSFLAALASHELAYAIPFLLALYAWMMLKRPFKEILIYVATELLMFWYVLFVYLYVDYFVIGHPADQVQYLPNFSIKKIANTLMWYVGWALGLPQMLVDFVTSGFGLDPRLMRFWGNYFSVIFPFFFLSLILIGLLKIKIFLKSGELLVNKYTISFMLWFGIAIAPMLLLPEHKQAHYLSLAIIGLGAALGYLLFVSSKKVKANKLAITIILSLTIFNLAAIQLSKLTYPAVARGRIAKELIADISMQYPSLPQGATILVKNDPNYPFIATQWGGSAKQASFVLSNENAFQVLYNDPSLKVYYEGSLDNIKLPEDTYTFVAEIAL